MSAIGKIVEDYAKEMILEIIKSFGNEIKRTACITFFF